MSTSSPAPLDVAILGGGLAGNLLARQLKRTRPELRVAIFDKSTKSSFKVGESTVELASNYLIRRLGLSRYLYERHLPKNGLRFFFDTAERDSALEELSEIGSVAPPYLPSFQVDRARLEDDLFAMNQTAGVEIHRGAQVSHLQLKQQTEPHQFLVTSSSEQRTVESRWVIDASGRNSLIARQRDLRLPESHDLSAVWGRFDKVVDLDDYGSTSFRARVNHSSRVLSTNHFCYPGYWIWFIPLASGLTSVGLVTERSRWRDEWRSPAGFQKMLREHAAVADLLQNAQLVDVMSYGNVSYGCKQYFSADRWGLVGDAGCFTDPLYSPGSDFIAVANDFLCDLISRDLKGEAIEERSQLFDDFMKFRYEATMRIYRDQYSLLGSYELFKVKWDFDIACYYNLWLDAYMNDNHLTVAYLRNQLQQKDLVLRVLDKFAELFKQVESKLLTRDHYYRGNLKRFTGEFETMKCAPKLGKGGSNRAALARIADAFNDTRDEALKLLKPDASDAPAPLPLSAFLGKGGLL